MVCRSLRRAFVGALVVGSLALGTIASANSVKGTVVVAKDPVEPASEHDGFWGRQALIVRPYSYDPRPEMVVVLEGGADDGTAPAQKPVLELAGERLWPPVLPVVTGWDVQIKNSTRKQQKFSTPGDDTLKAVMIPKNGDHNAKFAAPRAYLVTVVGQPHLKARVLALPTRWFSRVDGKGEWKLEGVPDGRYRVRVYYRDGWLKSKPTMIDVKAGAADAGQTVIGRDLELEEAGDAAAAPAAPAAPAPAKPAGDEQADEGSKPGKGDKKHEPAKKDEAKKKGK